jgi:type III pantothenate kinase
MLLAIDIGNTNINMGVFAGKRLLKRYRIPTRAKNYFLRLKAVVSAHQVKETVICSVVPAATGKLKKALQRLRLPNSLIGRDIIVPMKNLYRRPEQLGQDRLVNAYAGLRLYGSPLIVIDFGTAVTLDAVSRQGAYLGGLILPGLSISLEALSRRTALIPPLKLSAPKGLLGKDTKSSILSGLVLGLAVLSAGLSAKVRDTLGRSAKVVGTGGDINLISKYCKVFDAIDKNLTLKGIFMSYEISKKFRQKIS